MFNRAEHLTYLNLVHTLTQYLSFILILSSNLRLDIQSDPFPSSFLTKILFIFLISSMYVNNPPYISYISSS
jgi:hypothetical protein